MVVPKVWKRPHSTIYGKNVEFGNKLYSDKLGEINGRKFNSELPWQVRNSGGLSTASSSSSGSQAGYLSSILETPESTLLGSVLTGGSGGCGYPSSSSPAPSSSPYLSSSFSPSKLNCNNYADLLELTNPNRYSKRRQQQQLARIARQQQEKPRVRQPRIDFYDQYLDTFNRDLHHMSEHSILLHEPLLHRRAFDKYLDFNHEIGIFVPGNVSSSGGKQQNSLDSSSLRGGINSSSSNSSSMPHEFSDDGRSLIHKRTLNRGTTAANQTNNAPDQQRQTRIEHLDTKDSANTSFTPVCTTTQQTSLLPKHNCQLASSPYGQSSDGRKLSLGSINPHSYRPSLPTKTSTVHASDGEEFEFQDRSSPFYTDR